MTTDVTNLESMEVLVPATLVVEYHGSSAAESSAISAAVGAALRTVQTFLIVNRVTAAGAPRVVYSEWSPAGVKFTAAVPIAAVPPNVTALVRGVALARGDRSRTRQVRLSERADGGGAARRANRRRRVVAP